MTTQLTKADMDALRRAVEIDCRHDPVRRRQVAAKLAAGEDWVSVARSCAYRCQIESMHLQPWEHTIIFADDSESRALRRRVIAAGLSICEPEPLELLDRVEQRP